jgi:hypothetical protein
LRGKAALNNTKIINEYDVRQGAGCLYSLYCLVHLQDRFRVVG